MNEQRGLYCAICLRDAERARLTLRDLSGFYSTCSIGVELLEDACTWICTFCWTRVSQCIRFVQTARDSRIFLLQKCAFLEPAELHKFTTCHLPDTNLCDVENCRRQFETEFWVVPSEQRPITDNDLKIPVELLKPEVALEIKHEHYDDTEECYIESTTHEQELSNDNSSLHMELLPNTLPINEESIIIAQTSSRPLRKKKSHKRPKSYVQIKSGSSWSLKLEEDNAKFLGLTPVLVTEKQQLEEIVKKKESVRYKKAAYKCDICAQICTSEEYLSKHMKLCHDESAGRHECSICRYRFKTTSGLSRHKSMEHLRLWRCGSCNAVVNREQWPVHGNNCNTEGTHQCDMCPKKFKTEERLKRHKQRSHLSARLTCEICKKSLKNKLVLTNHLRIHTGEKPFECEQCGKKFSSSSTLYLHNRNKHAPAPPDEPMEERYCIECDMCFKSKKIYEAHLEQSKAHNDPNSFKYACDFCPKRFPKLCFKDMHVKQHHQENKDHRCPHCNKAFALENYLNKHIRKTHFKVEQPRDFICDLCAAAFKTKKYLETHRAVVHENQRPHRCDVCDATFGFSGALYKHKQQHRAGAAVKKAAASTSKTNMFLL